MKPSEQAAGGRVRIALLGSNRAVRGRLRAALHECGVEVVVEESLSTFVTKAASMDGVQGLLVDLDHCTDRDLDTLDALMDMTELPLMFSEAAHRGSNKRWIRSLAEKLRSAVVGPTKTAETAKAAPTPAVPAMPEPTRLGCPVWVLGASFGGPEAVKRFLAALPHAPDAVFILAQHIGEGFAELLAQQLNRSTPFQVAVAEEGLALESGRIFVAPVFHRLHIDENDCFHLVPNRPERLSYSPSIDSVMTEVANRYGPNAGAIVFSGMGDDAAEGCRAIVGAGGTVWAQDSKSCAIDSMPACARATGLVSHVADPEALAGDLVRHLEAEAESGSKAYKQG